MFGRFVHAREPVMRVSNRAILFLTRLSATMGAVVANVAMSLLGSRASESEEAPESALARPADKGKEDIMITIVYDNNPGPKDLTPAWGFACVIRGPEKTILFDTGGDGRTLLGNMRQLNIEPKEIDVVVLSHIHGDHTGGLSSFLRVRRGVPVYVPSGFPASFLEQIRLLGGRPVDSDQSQLICPGIRTTGTLGRGAIEEHGLCVQIHDGWVVITGCAHPGLANMAAKAKDVTNGQVSLVMGGFHMGWQSRSEIEAVIDRFEKLGVQRAAPSHCSGARARRLFKKRLGDRCVLADVGSVFGFRAER